MIGMKKIPLIPFVTMLLVSCDVAFSSSSLGSSEEISSSTTSTSTESSIVSSENSTPSQDNTPIEYELVWNDEFDYTGLPDSSKWGYDVGGGGWGNNELQYYTQADLDNASVANGELTITALKETFQNREYTSARLVTKNKGDFLYGRMEARAKLPSGRGTWPAIWMLPTDWAYGGWPTSGEIDIMEHVGYDPNVVHATIHTDTYNHSKGTQVGESITLADVFNTYHTYAIEWQPGLIKAFIDDQQYAEFAFDVNDVMDGPTHLAWPFDRDFHFIFNIAIGGNWGGVQGIDDTIFPTSMIVDYVRVYQMPYGRNDVTPPGRIYNPRVLKTTGNSLAVAWNPVTDNRLVRNYIVRVNGEVAGAPSVPAIYLDNLTPETTYQIQIEAVDFNLNISNPVILEATTSGYPSVNERIEAEDYIAQEGVQFESTSDVGGGENAGWLNPGDYLEYQINVPTTGNYRLSLRVASKDSSGQLTLLSDNVEKTTMDLPITGDWQAWQTVNSSSFTLNEGVQTLRLRVDRQGFNLNYFEIQSL